MQSFNIIKLQILVVLLCGLSLFILPQSSALKEHFCIESAGVATPADSMQKYSEIKQIQKSQANSQANSQFTQNSQANSLNVNTSIGAEMVNLKRDANKSGLGERLVCRGGRTGMSLADNAAGDAKEDERKRYNELKDLYEGCEYVEGNLEICEFRHNLSLDFSFLSSIREVSGYVLIFYVLVPVIPLTNLRIIHGKTLLQRDWQPEALDRVYSSVTTSTSSGRSDFEQIALALVSNYRDANEIFPSLGLETLEMPKLTEITKGNVLFRGNKKLCHIHTINWDDIITTKRGFKVHSDLTKCGTCHASCSQMDGTPHCWGKNRDMCQRLTRTICDKNCDWRCYGKGANQCCHKECAGGCTDAEASHCWACKHFKDGGMCKEDCPGPLRYDPEEGINKQQKPKYKYAQQCMDQCPGNMLQENYACVLECTSDEFHAPDGICQPCYDNCPKKCKGNDDKDGPNSYLNPNNIDRFENCSLVEGNIRILMLTFHGDGYFKIPPLRVEQLSALRSVQEITGHLYIDSDDERLKNLSFLSNLRTIYGRTLLYPQTKNGVVTGTALGLLQTKLESLNLNSLRAIRSGDVVIESNSKLCFTGSPKYWKSLLTSDSTSDVLINNNKATEQCVPEGLVCHEQCSSAGCMGLGDEQCVECKHYRYGKRCVESCESLDERPRLFADTRTGQCVPCHVNCRDTCDGDLANQCHACANGSVDGFCVSKCDSNMFVNSTGHCQKCNRYCDYYGCTGAGNHVGPGGCKACDMAHNVSSDETERLVCVSQSSKCPDGHFISENLYRSSVTGAAKRGCTKCHKSCRTCSGYGSTYCTFCPNKESTKDCKFCSDQCIDCNGLTESDCVACRYLYVYEDFPNRETNKKFNCTDTCPDWAPNKLHINGTSICVEDKYAPNSKRQMAIIVGVIVGGLLLIGALIACIFLLRRQVAKVEENKIRLTAKITGVVECEPLTPSNARPDMSHLRLIRESELRRGAIIGSGAFGTVYKGVWIPEGENIKIPVAIKVLHKGTSPAESGAMLDEARIMASAIHPCCVHVLAACMTAEMMLITPLMPLGCLLDYVRKNKDNVGSKSLLNWCTQIARGMVYLESRGIIHRDLAARNVLVQSSTHVKITDFGLAKLVNEDGQFYAASGKVPIKWLALECIRQRVYTHKSDVWSYGVTIWELFTYGNRPYDNVSAKDVVDLLEKGERLSQPSICTIDVYMIMIKCWMLDAESRPSFEELEIEFAKMARDPGRYLVIPNDSLVRLPSQNTDALEMLRNTSLALDGPEEVVTAEEYVNEIARRQSLQPPINDVKMMKRLNTDEETGPLNKRSSGATPEALLIKAARLEEEDEDRSGPRYSPDPCSFSYNKEFPQSAYLDDAKFATASPPGQQGSIKRLPLDETEYLQPQSSAPAAYLELSEDYEPTSSLGYVKDVNDDRSANEQSTLLKPGMNAISNPEYFNDPVKT